MLEMSGAPQALDQALRVITRGGRISLLGIFAESPSIDLSERVIMQGIRLHGIYGRLIYDTWERTQALLRSGSLDVSPIITHRLGLDDWERAFDLVASRNAGKVVLLPSSASGLDRMTDTPTRARARNPLAFLDAEIDELKAKGLYRRLRVVQSEQKSRCVIDGREVITLSSNNYLGLTTHPKLRRAALDAVERFGAGSGAVRTIAGTMSLHEELEARLATFKHTEAVLTFQSGFTANTGVIPILAPEGASS